MALASGAPVIPVAMIDTEKIQPPGKVVPKLMRPGIRIGKPLDFSRYQGMEGDRFILRSVTDEVMYEIMKLSGQEYVDIYATAAKRQIADAAKAAEAGRRRSRRQAAAGREQGRNRGSRSARGRDDGRRRPTGAGPAVAQGQRARRCCACRSSSRCGGRSPATAC